MKSSQDIHDMIQCFQLDATERPELTASRILDILAAINERMDGIVQEFNHPPKTEQPTHKESD